MEDATNGPLIAQAELERHTTAEDCWIVVHSRVYDITAFLDEHPGGAASELHLCTLSNVVNVAS